MNCFPCYVLKTNIEILRDFKSSIRKKSADLNGRGISPSDKFKLVQFAPSNPTLPSFSHFTLWDSKRNVPDFFAYNPQMQIFLSIRSTRMAFINLLWAMVVSVVVSRAQSCIWQFGIEMRRTWQFGIQRRLLSQIL